MRAAAMFFAVFVLPVGMTILFSWIVAVRRHRRGRPRLTAPAEEAEDDG